MLCFCKRCSVYLFKRGIGVNLLAAIWAAKSQGKYDDPDHSYCCDVGVAQRSQQDEQKKTIFSDTELAPRLYVETESGLDGEGSWLPRKEGRSRPWIQRAISSSCRLRCSATQLLRGTDGRFCAQTHASHSVA
jgi:hypothetical protein